MPRTAVLLLNFGEPETPTMGTVVPFLERIFALNAPLMGQDGPSDEEVRARSRALAEARAPGLIEEYEEIGGSPLHRQAREQAEALETELRARGHDVIVVLGMQFTEPSIAEAIGNARAAGARSLVSLPVYPLSGPTTNLAALREVDRQLGIQEWSVPNRQVAGWHRHPSYLRTRASAIQRLLDENGLSLQDAGTKLMFSAHGTPLKYLQQGSRYEEYVKEFCAAVAEAVGASDYLLGYQNHTNRPGVQWTQPNIEKVVSEIGAERIVVDPVSFMHEQSETLAELDVELREEVEERGIDFYRVPIPYLAADFIAVLADLVESACVGLADASRDVRLHQCRCKPTAGTLCTNGAR
ncbi:MAG: ferrochelatase [Gemmatimonas sp.]|nr:ferrochelatase [Gemmatimonas sp.]